MNMNFYFLFYFFINIQKYNYTVFMMINYIFKEYIYIYNANTSYFAALYNMYIELCFTTFRFFYY